LEAPLPCGDPDDSVPCATNLLPVDVPPCVDAPPLRIVGTEPKSTPSTVCRSESDRCLTLRRSGRHSSSMYELANGSVGPFKTMTPVSEPATKVRYHLLIFRFLAFL
jgi:hypothetical protein